MFTPLGPVVGAMHIGFGHIFGPNYNNIIPTERFFLGGPFSLRGYEYRATPPFGNFLSRQLLWLVPQGGKSMFNCSLELRFPIFKSISGALFQDIGFLSKKFNNLFEDPLLSSGFGIRFATPVGLLRFDIGWKWRRRYEGDSLMAWILTMGHAF